MPQLDVGHRNAAGRAACTIDDDAAVHFLIVDLDPLSRRGGFRSAGWSCCRNLRETRRRYRPSTSRQSCCDGWHRAVIGDLRQDLAQRFGRRRALRSTGKAGVVAALADRDVLDAENTARRGDDVENLGQDQAVDDVAADFDFFDKVERFGGLPGIGLPISRGSFAGLRTVWASFHVGLRSVDVDVIARAIIENHRQSRNARLRGCYKPLTIQAFCQALY